MVGGQSVDLALAKGANSNDFSSEDYKFESVRNLKTSALMRLGLRVGAILADANHLELTNLSRFATLLGDAYQLSDDLLDLEEDGKIFQSNRTFAAGIGQDAAQLKLKTVVEEAKQVLIENFPPNEARGCLIQLTNYLVERKN
jgi:geranylgeranyl diphosphate synthase type II